MTSEREELNDIFDALEAKNKQEAAADALSGKYLGALNRETQMDKKKQIQNLVKELKAAYSSKDNQRFKIVSDLQTDTSEFHGMRYQHVGGAIGFTLYARDEKKIFDEEEIRTEAWAIGELICSLLGRPLEKHHICRSGGGFIDLGKHKGWRVAGWWDSESFSGYSFSING